MRNIEINDINDLAIAAKAIIEQTASMKIVAFYGGMGAGKTTLIKEICSQLGVSDTVTSPTFALVNHYSTHQGDDIYHFDFYRLEKPEEAFDFGYEEYFESGSLCLVEWPEKIEGLIPDNVLKVNIEITGATSRIISIP